MKLMVSNKNEILFQQYEKEVSAKQTIQKNSAMGDNVKFQILSQDMVRRLLNTSDSMGAETRELVVDNYSQKLINSGYPREQVRRIIINGIRGLTNKRRRRAAEGKELRQTAARSKAKRYKDKLLSKSTWFREQGSKNTADKSKKLGAKKIKEPMMKKETQLQYRTVLFVENSEGGELVNRIKEQTRRLAPTLGFAIRVVERNGRSLRSRFPLTNLWDGTPCPRQDCITCSQGAEVLPQCTKVSVVYENLCQACNEGAAGKKELKVVKDGSIYVGESSRSIFERSREHWRDFKCGSDKSHILRHQGATHPGEEPRFIMRTVKYYRTALSRQIGEAVRIARRGGAGAILNSKSEFDRCHIPRLVLEEIDEEESKKQEEQMQLEEWERVEQQAEIWGAEALKDRREDDRKRWEQEKIIKRAEKDKTRRAELAPGEPQTKKKRKLPLLEEQWGEDVEQGANLPPDPDSGCLTPHNPAPSSPSQDGQHLTILRPAPGVQKPITEYICVTDHPLRSGDDQETKSGGMKETIGDMEDNIAGDDQEQDNKGKGNIETKITEPSIEKGGITEVCMNDKRGRCKRHGTLMKMISVSSKKWCDLGRNKGYGWKYGKTKKFICGDKDNPPLCLGTTDHKERFISTEF